MAEQLLGPYAFNVGVIVGLYVILALGLNVTIGYAGQPSLGQAAFWAIGAYCAGILATQAGLSFWASVPLAMALTGVMGLLLGMPSIRVREDFLVIVTIGLTLVVQSLAEHLPITGGALGIQQVPRATVWGTPLSARGYFVVVGLCAVIGALVSRRIQRSWLGLAFFAVRDDDGAAEVLGLNTRRLKVVAFAIGAAYAGLAGGLLAHYLRFVTPELFGMGESVIILSMIVIGGLGTIRGAVAGAILLGSAPETLRWAAEYRMSIIGSLMLLVVIFQPGGLLGAQGLWTGLGRGARGRRRRAR